MIALTFAVPQESRAFATRACALHVFHTGIGVAAADRAVRALLAQETPTALIAAGFAGALDPALRVGDVVVATNRSAPAFVALCRERWKADAQVSFGELTTAALAAESTAAKAQLARDSSACAVDMETSAIAAVCHSAGIPLLALRVISDAATAPLPLPFSVSYDLAAQRPRPAAVAAYLARHPRAILPLAKFIRDLTFARRELARRLAEILPAVTDAAERH
jgi:adenosylhomocysteine nucleosidase